MDGRRQGFGRARRKSISEILAEQGGLDPKQLTGRLYPQPITARTLGMVSPSSSASCRPSSRGELVCLIFSPIRRLSHTNTFVQTITKTPGLPSSSLLSCPGTLRAEMPGQLPARLPPLFPPPTQVSSSAPTPQSQTQRPHSNAAASLNGSSFPPPPRPLPASNLTARPQPQQPAFPPQLPARPGTFVCRSFRIPFPSFTRSPQASTFALARSRAGQDSRATTASPPAASPSPPPTTSSPASTGTSSPRPVGTGLTQLAPLSPRGAAAGGTRRRTLATGRSQLHDEQPESVEQFLSLSLSRVLDAMWAEKLLNLVQTRGFMAANRGVVRCRGPNPMRSLPRSCRPNPRSSRDPRLHLHAPIAGCLDGAEPIPHGAACPRGHQPARLLHTLRQGANSFCRQRRRSAVGCRARSLCSCCSPGLMGSMVPLPWHACAQTSRRSSSGSASGASSRPY